jgi:ribonuclease G
MTKELYVSSNPHETRVALAEDDQLAEIFYERENEYTLAGSIYKGRVTRVLPGMQSAFVDIGLERDAFLYVSDFLDLQDEEDEDFEVAVKTNGASDNTQRQDRSERPERREHRRDHRNERGERNEQPRREREDNRPPVESAAPTAVFEGGYSDTEEAEEINAETLAAAADSLEGGETAEEGGDGARRWKGRRRRRGGRRGRNGEPRFERTESQQQAATASEREPEVEEGVEAPQEPVQREERAPRQGREERPPRRDREERESYGPPAGYQPIILPGESLSKYRNRPQATVETQDAPSHAATEVQHHEEPESETDREAIDIVAAAFEHVAPEEHEAETQAAVHAEHEADDQHEQHHQHDEEEPTEGFAQLRAPRQVAEMRRDPAIEVYEEATEEEFEEEEQVEAAERDEQVSAQAAFTGTPVEETQEHHREEPAEAFSTETEEASEEQHEHGATYGHVREYEKPEQVLPESAPEGKTLEHETFEGEETPDAVQLAQDDSSESDMELEEETLEASGSDASRWIPQVADIEEDIHDHEVEDFEYSAESGEGAGIAEDEFAEEEGEEEEGEEPEDSAVAADPNAPPKRRFDRGRRGRRGRNGERGGGGPRMKNIQSRNTPLISDLLKEGQEILVQIA